MTFEEQENPEEEGQVTAPGGTSRSWALSVPELGAATTGDRGHERELHPDAGVLLSSQRT